MLEKFDRNRLKINFFEEDFNIPSYIPLASTVKGVHRTVKSLLQIVIAVGAAAIDLFAKAYRGINPEFQRRTFDGQYNALPYELKNAASNLVRGLVEMIPLIGNLSLYLFDKNYFAINKAPF